MREYPTIDGLKSVLKVLESFGFYPTYIQQELIRAELQTYRLKVLKDIFNIDKDPVPSVAIEVTGEPENDEGIFISFINPLQFVEIVDENGNPDKNFSKGELLKLIGLYVSKTIPEKIQLGFAPREMLKELKKTNDANNSPIIIDEEIKPKDDKKNKLDYN